MTDLVVGARGIDAILVLMAIEAVVLVVHFTRTGRGVAPGNLLWNMLAGGSLLVALRFALTGARWQWIVLCLSAALVAHIIDLRQRWRRGG